MEPVDPTTVQPAGKATSEMTESLPFVYPALDLGKKSIRVVEILPGLDRAIIRCKMEIILLEEKEYTCLSYTWEPKLPYHDIEIDSKIVTVGDNLWQFLHAARSASVRGLLWIDTLCINQSDLIEKNHQVAMMGEIYTQTRKTLIWLGICVVDGTFKNLWCEITTFIELIPWGHYKSTEIIPGIEGMIRNIGHNRRASLHAEVVKCLSLPYWSRIWIIQEIMLTPGSTLLFTNIGEINLSHFATVVEEIIHLSRVEGPKIDETLPGFKLMSSQHTLHQFSSEAELTPSLDSLIRAFAQSGCVNLLDRVYALLSLAKNGTEFTVDYDIEPETLLQRIMAQTMNNKSVDELLTLGATLIEALNIKPRRSTSISPYIEGGISSDKSSSGRPEDLCLLIHYDRSVSVARPVWGEAYLRTVKDSDSTINGHTTTCLYLAIYDAGDTHVFEYAVEEQDSSIIVKYARAHEYMQGQPQICAEPQAVDDDISYLWIDLPSEEVYYYSDPAGTGHKHLQDHTLPYLSKWTSPQLKLKELSTSPLYHNSLPTGDQSRRLKPSTRYIIQEVCWHSVAVYSTLYTTSKPESRQRFCGFMKEPKLFQSKAQDIINSELAFQLQYGSKICLKLKVDLSGFTKLSSRYRYRTFDTSKLKLSPQTIRSTTLRLEYVRSDEDSDNDYDTYNDDQSE